MKTDYKTDQKFKTKRDHEQLNRHQQDAKRSILTAELSIKTLSHGNKNSHNVKDKKEQINQEKVYMY